MKTHTMRAYCPFGLGEVAVDIRFNYSPGRPAVMYLRNGDPGYPADPPEVEFVSARLVNIRDERLNKMAAEWAEDYLAEDVGFGEACEAAEALTEHAREQAAETRAELMREDRR